MTRRRGHISRRGKRSWQLKFDTGTDASGRRRTRYVTVRGRLQDAQRELARLLAAADTGQLPEASTITVAEHLRRWLDGAHGLSAKTVERYRQLAERQIIPHLGAVRLQALSVRQVRAWHETLARPDTAGNILSARTIGHAHRVLHRALALAVADEILTRNVAGAVRAPRVDAGEMEILAPEQIAAVLAGLRGHRLFPLAALALATGMRRGELLALQVGDVDCEAGTVTVQRSLEETAAGLRVKPPKTRHGRRTIALPAGAVAVLRAHWRQQLEYRLALGLGKPEPDALLFSQPDGTPLSPDNLSRDWRRTCRVLGLPLVSFHALRHTHASALIASGLDVVQIAKRLGHGSAVVTLRVYAHLFGSVDNRAADAIEAVLRLPGEA